MLVAGSTGAGKTTLAKALAGRIGSPHVEMDALYHGPGWVPRPEFLDDVAVLVGRPAWITEWQYSRARPLLLEHADTIVWLDHPFRTAMRRLVVRTVVRRLRRTVLWNGNVEPPLLTVFTDPEHLLRWGWKSHGRVADKLTAVLASEHGPRLSVVRLRGQREVDAWLAGPLLRAARAGEGSV